MLTQLLRVSSHSTVDLVASDFMLKRSLSLVSPLWFIIH